MGEYDECGIVFQTFEELERFWLEHTENFKIVYQPVQPKDEFDYIASLVYSVGDCTFVVEELDTFCSPYEFSLDFANIIQRGRHAGINFIGVSQRPYGINRTISAQCKEILTFQQSEPRDITFLTMYMGEDVEKVRNLGKYEYLHWNSGDITIHKPDGGVSSVNDSDNEDQQDLDDEEEFDNDENNEQKDLKYHEDFVE